MIFLSPADFFIKESFRKYHQGVKQFGFRSVTHLGPNCVQRLSADTTSNQKVKSEQSSC